MKYPDEAREHDPLGVMDLVDDQRIQIEIRDRVLLDIRRALGPDGIAVPLHGLADLIKERLLGPSR